MFVSKPKTLNQRESKRILKRKMGDYIDDVDNIDNGDYIDNANITVIFYELTTNNK
jgi:hypothetical protein